MINGEVMDRSAGAVETSQKHFRCFTALQQAAEGPEASHFVPSHGPLMEELGSNEAM